MQDLLQSSFRVTLHLFKEETGDWKGFSRKEFLELIQTVRSVLIQLTKLRVLTEKCMERTRF